MGQKLRDQIVDRHERCPSHKARLRQLEELISGYFTEAVMEENVDRYVGKE